MPREAPEIRLIRETLEGVLHPATAGAVLFEALSEQGGTLPTIHADVIALVRGPLARRLVDKLGGELAQSLIEQLELLLTAIAPSDAKSRVRKRPSRQDEPTRNLELSRETLPVFVLSGGTDFAQRISAALGPHVMSAVQVADTAMLRTRLEQVLPGFVLVDASDFPAIEPRDLVRQIEALSEDVVKAIWGADLPYGMSLLAMAQQSGLTMTPFDRREGIEPLMDMIRSRRAPL
jgi:hypothetical protein